VDRDRLDMPKPRSGLGDPFLRNRNGAKSNAKEIELAWTHIKKK